MNDGRLKAKLLRHEVSKYLSKMGFSCHYEVGLNRWGKLRADVLAFNYKRRLIVVEVKSSLADYKKGILARTSSLVCDNQDLPNSQTSPLPLTTSSLNL